MRTPLAWRNVVHDKVRAATVLASIGFSILLLFVQIGFYTSCRLSATLIYRMVDFDLGITASSYSVVVQAETFPRSRLYQVRAVEGVESADGLRLVQAAWRNPRTGDRQDIFAIAVDPQARPFTSAGLNEQLPRLNRPNTALADAVSHPQLGGVGPGDVVEVSGRDVRIVGRYAAGIGFTALGGMVTSLHTLAALRGESAPEKLTLIAVKLAPGTAPSDAARAIRDALPADVRVWPREALFHHERAYWMSSKPMGLMFSSGVAIALLVGLVILYQVLAADVTRRLREYATLKAIGYAPRAVYGVIVRQGVVLGLLAFLPAALAAAGIYRTLRAATDLPIFMTPHKVAFVLAFTLVMCALSGTLAVRRVTRADPAELF